ncbi:hypothetical protein OG944_03990 [Streptomyces anulatus]|uniref:hypothetical protein n=1 Tax=Streptomyces TaxID=1883 RepID=UPI000BFE3B77|nr:MULTISPECIES: hypothetical protein [Streptomyces]MCX4502196.1 hypothetical protein [Streptomyces anulatus]WTC75296.1 hypothetical protein OG882_35145 [Streptomyces anulatus]WUD87317.1 hypothetical protein OG703_03865 [Streptomyces anulatus]
MATDFKTQRFQELFDALDPDRNDVVGKHSFDNLISLLAHNSDTNIRDLRKAFHEFWQAVQSRSEYRSNLSKQQFVDALNATHMRDFDSLSGRVFASAFGFGEVTKDKFVRYYTAAGSDEATAQEDFTRLHGDRDGGLHRKEFHGGLANYLHNSDPASSIVLGIV